MKKQSSSKPVAGPNQNATAMPGHRTPVKFHHPLLAPSLASAAVLMAMMGLSRDYLMHEAPAFHVTTVRQGMVGALAKSPAAERPQGSFADGFASREPLVPADQPPAPGRENLDESLDRRRDDSSNLSAEKGDQDGKEIDSLWLSGSREANTRSHARTAVEADSEIGSALLLPDKPEDKRFAEPSRAKPSAFAVPQEEIRQTPFQKKVDLAGKDEVFKLQDNEPSRREYEETASGGKAARSQAASNRTNSPQAEIAAAELRGIAAVTGAFNQSSHFDFLAHYQQTDKLHFQAATGYWANAYIPGDPEIRLLRARLAQQDRSWLEHNKALERDVEPLQQPFDAPANNALALSLMADSNAVANSEYGATRMRLQVGIRGIEHRRGQRPAMNVGIVVDLPDDAPDDVRIATRALLDALLHSQQAGDRFSLVMTGSGLVVEAADFRFGSLQLAKQKILGQGPEPELSLSKALN